MLPPSPPTKEQEAAALAAASTGQPTDPPVQPAIFYRPGDLKQQLQMPLGNTLGPKVPSTDAFSGPEANTVQTLTLSNSFTMTSQGQRILLDR